jgi:hypothetical protein
MHTPSTLSFFLKKIIHANNKLFMTTHNIKITVIIKKNVKKNPLIPTLDYLTIRANYTMPKKKQEPKTSFPLPLRNSILGSPLDITRCISRIKKIFFIHV